MNAGNTRLKPVRTVIVFVIFLLLFFFFISSIPFGYLPQDARNSILIRIEYNGAFEREMERLITNPIEKEVAKISGISEVVSVCEQSRTRISITLLPDIDLNSTYLKVREIVDYVYTTLPEGVQRPVIVKSDINSRPVFIAAFDRKPGYSEDRIKSMFENIDGVGDIELGGSFKKEIQIRVDPEKIRAKSLMLSDIIRSLRLNNIIAGFALQTTSPAVCDGRLKTVGALQSLFITRTIPLRDVADVVLTEAEKDSEGKVNGRDKVIIYINKSGNADTVRLCRAVRTIARGEFDGVVLYDYGEKIEQAFLEITLFFAAGLILVILFSFIVFRRAFPALAIAVSTFFLVALVVFILTVLHQELNLITLAGLVLGIGLSINAQFLYFSDYFKVGEMQYGAGSLSRLPAVSSFMIICAIFFPLAFSARVLVILFGPLAVAVCAASAGSAILLSLFVPSLCSLLDFKNKKIASSAVHGHFNGSSLMYRSLKNSFYFFNRNKWLGYALIVIISGVTLVVSLNLKQEYFSVDAGDSFTLKLEYPGGTTLQSIMAELVAFDAFVAGQGDIRYVASKYEKERATFDITMRKNADLNALIATLRGKEREHPGAFFYFPEKTGEEASFDCVITGSGIEKVRDLCFRLSGRLKEIEGVKSVIFHFKDALPSKKITISPESAHSVGVSPLEAQQTIYWLLSNPVASKWNPPGDEADIRIFPRSRDQVTTDYIMHYPVPGAQGILTELKNIGTMAEVPETGRIYHYNRQRSASFSVISTLKEKERVLLNVKKTIKDFPFPSGYQAIAGMDESAAAQMQFSSIQFIVLAAILIFMVLVFRFESIRVPLVIFFQIPLAFILPLIVLSVAGIHLSFPVLIGLILSGGIAVQNQIVLFDRARHHGKGPLFLYRTLRRTSGTIVVGSCATVLLIIPFFFIGTLSRGILFPLSLTVISGILGSFFFLLLSTALFSKRLFSKQEINPLA